MNIKIPIVPVIASIFICIAYGQSAVNRETPLINEFGEKNVTVDVAEVLKETTLGKADVLIKQEALSDQIDAVLNYFHTYKEDDPFAVNAGIFSLLGITLADVEDTLRFSGKIIDEDRERGVPCRLTNPQFLNEHFRVIQWFPFRPGHSSAKEIRLTKYAVFTIKGTLEKTTVCKYALYALPSDEKGMSLKEAEKKKDSLSRFRYTKQQVLDGAYEEGGAEPLIWVTRDGLEESLMEGSICVELPNGEKRYFNVDRNNGISYDPRIRSPRDQKRYWYFGRVAQPRGYGMDIQSQMPIFPDAAVAGDVYNLGLGKLMGISYIGKDGNRKIRLVILADTGGAFSPNLDQLDYYCGVIQTGNDFREHPEFVRVYILCLRHHQDPSYEYPAQKTRI
jgi:hypothetical protein